MYKKLKKMIKDLELRGRSKDTIKNMVCAMNSFSKYYNQRPKTLGEKQIIHYLNYLINDKKLQKGTENYINSILNFLYVVILERSWSDIDFHFFKLSFICISLYMR